MTEYRCSLGCKAGDVAESGPERGVRPLHLSDNFAGDRQRIAATPGVHILADLKGFLDPLASKLVPDGLLQACQAAQLVGDGEQVDGSHWQVRARVSRVHGVVLIEEVCGC